MDNQNTENSSENQTTNSAKIADLEKLKQQALEVLTPLADQIDDAPENRFEILIMAARSSGDSSLLSKALEAAQQIENTSAKANAVLDVLNEVGYQISSLQQN